MKMHLKISSAKVEVILSGGGVATDAMWVICMVLEQRVDDFKSFTVTKIHPGNVVNDDV